MDPSIFDGPTWWENVSQTVDISGALGVLNVQPTAGKGLTANFAMAHGSCYGAHGDGRGALFIGSRSDRLHCRKCDASFGVVEVVALVLGYEMPKSAWPADNHTVQMVRAECAAHGWCESEHGTAIRRPVRRGGATNLVKRIQQAWPNGRARDEVSTLRRQYRRWQPKLLQYCLSRDWPADLSRDISGLNCLNEPPVPGVAWAVGQGTLPRLATAINRELLFPIYDAAGMIRSVSRRWHHGHAPMDDRPKAMALASKLVGSSMDWPGHVRAFGSIPRALENQGCIFLCEGAPDYLIAQGLVRQGRGHSALAADSAGGLVNIARAIAKQVRDQGLMDIEIMLFPDLKRTEDGGIGLQKMEEAARILGGLTTVKMVRFPIPMNCDEVDLSDIAARCKSGEALWKRIEQHTEILYEAFPDLHQPSATGYLPKIAYTPGVTVLRASLGTGKTQRAAEVSKIVQAQGGGVIAINHRRSLSHELGRRLVLPVYETLARGPIHDSVAICLNSLPRISDPLIEDTRLVIIDELESVMAQLFGDTLTHGNPNRTDTADVATTLRALLQSVIRNRGMILIADAHAHEATVRALINFCRLAVKPRTVEHITAFEAQITDLPSSAALIDDLISLLNSNKRIALATDSRREATKLANYLTENGYRTKLYTGDMPSARRRELGDVNTAWSPTECQIVIYTPAVDAGVSYDPSDSAHRFDVVMGLFTGAAQLPASTIQQMMFRARHVTDHRLFIAKRDNCHSADFDTIHTELEHRTTAAEARLTCLGRAAPIRSRSYGDLLDLETAIEQMRRKRTRLVHNQVMEIYRARGATILISGDVAKTRKRQLGKDLKAIQTKYDKARADRVINSPVLTADAYDEARKEIMPDDPTRDSLEHSRLVRMFGPEQVNEELIIKDRHHKVTHATRNAVKFRLALQGYWKTLAEPERLRLLGGFGSRRKTPDLPILAALAVVLLPKEFWLQVAAPSPKEIEDGAPVNTWSKLHFAETGTHLKALKLLDELAEARGVSPAAVLQGVRCNREDLTTPEGAVHFVGGILRWIGIGTKSTRHRQPELHRVYRIDPTRWSVQVERCFVETARQRGINVDPLDCTAPSWAEISHQGEWKCPEDQSVAQCFLVDPSGAWIVGDDPIDPQHGSLNLQQGSARYRDPILR